MGVRRVAVLVDTATGWGRRIIRGVLDFCAQNGPWDLRIEPRGREEKFELSDARVDGVIARVASNEMAIHLLRRKVPVVNVSGVQLEKAKFPLITTDRMASARMAEAHFRDRAVSHFAYIGPMEFAHVRRQESAFEEVLAKSQTKCHRYAPDDPAGLANPLLSSQDDLIAWLKMLPKPVGIYAWGSQIGRRIINACRDADITVPHDVAVLGGDFDDLLCDASYPALSGIVTPATQIGRKAAAILDEMMQGGKPPPASIFIQAEEIEERLSTDVLAVGDPQCRKALVYLRAHACEAIGVEDILRRVPMNRRMLERRFVQFLGRTPAQEITRLRIDRARELLSKTDLSLQEIAASCGYATDNYLGIIFRKKTGMPPSKYRNLARGK